MRNPHEERRKPTGLGAIQRLSILEDLIEDGLTWDEVKEAFDDRAPQPDTVTEGLIKALEAYQSANRIHNDSEAELFEAGEIALAALSAKGK